MKNYFSNLYPAIRYVLAIHLFALLCLTLIRFILFVTNFQNTADAGVYIILEAFWIGMHFDNVIVSYVSLPALIFAVFYSFWSVNDKIIQYTYCIYYSIIYIPFLILAVSDIPYFNYFFKHLDISIYTWLKKPSDVFSMIQGESSYYLYFIICLVLIAVFIVGTIFLSKKLLSRSISNNRFVSIVFTFILISFILLGFSRRCVLKRYLHSKLSIELAYFCEYTFVNELTHNSIYCFV